MTRTDREDHARVGDTIVAHAPHGASPRRGVILEILGRPGHEHYRVRWDEEHESIFFPADGVTIEPHDREAAQP